MTKKEFVEVISEKSNFSQKDSAVLLDAVIDTLASVLAKGDSITFTGFGTFSVKHRAERNGRNPATGASIKIPASKAVIFKVGAKLKAAVNS